MLMMSLAMIEEPADRLRFEDIYQSYHKQMLLVARGVLDNPQDAEDAVQEALFRIARSMEALRNREDWAVRGYVLTVAKNMALNIYNENSKRLKCCEEAEKTGSLDDTVFQKVVSKLDHQLVLRAVRHLDPLYRQILVLVYIQKQSPREAARLLGRKEETVRKQLYRGKKLLLEWCRKEGLSDDDA